MARHGYRKKKRTHLPAAAEAGSQAETHKSFVFRRGRFGVFMKPLEADMRKLLHPNTAQRLKESRKNQLKDFVHIAGPLNVSHFLILTATEQAAYLRLAKVPRGPTITLRILAYSLMHDVAAAQASQHGLGQALDHPPLVVLSGFANQGEQVALTAALIQGLFPPINVAKTSLAACKRVVLVTYDAASGKISLRHYSIHTAPSGVTKGIKSVVAGTALPSLAQLEDVSELLLKSGYGSESEGEEAAESRVALTSPGSTRAATRQCRIRLHEMGPRLEMEVVKAEEGLCSGRVLFHAHVQKPPEAAAAQEATIQDRDQLRTKRRQQQEDNVKRKASKQAAEQQAKRQKDSKGKPRAAGRVKQWWEPEGGPAQPDDDRKFYMEEVGEDPGDINRQPRPPRQAPGQTATKPKQSFRESPGQPNKKAARSAQGPPAKPGQMHGRRQPAEASSPGRPQHKRGQGAAAHKRPRR